VTTADGKGAEEKDIDCLTPEEEKELVRFYCEKAVELADTYKPPLPTTVRVRISSDVEAHNRRMIDN
jgi:cyclin H